MKQLRFLLIGAVLAAAPAAAQTPRDPATSHAATIDSYLDGLGHQMSITPHQKPAWDRYADTLNAVGQQMQGEHHTKMEAMGTASWQERCTMVDQMLVTRKDAADAVHKAATDLMPTLNAAQKQKARSMLPGLVLPPAAGFG